MKEPVHWMGDEECYGMRSSFSLLGNDLWAHIFFNSSRFAEQERGFYSYIDRLEAELNRMASKRLQKKYRDFFLIPHASEKVGALAFIRSQDAISQALNTAGFVVFITNDEHLTPSEVLALYRRRDDVEKAFDDLKNGVDFKRFKTHIQTTTEGKAFVGFVALILRSCMHNLLLNDENTKNISMKKALLELTKLGYITTEDGSEWFLPPTKSQSSIAKALRLVLV